MPYKDPEKQKAAQARYYQENKTRLNKSQNIKRNLWRRRTQEVKENSPCKDCGERFPHYVMDFDHLPENEKLFNIGAQLARFPSLAALEEEMAKCDVVCANCHRHRTFMRLTKE
jgi:hypothetical protein